MSTQINLTDLTNGALTGDNNWEGTGVFDVLIAAVSSNIEGQYNLGRLSGSDYANVYLGSMQSVIAQSVSFLLQKDVAEMSADKTFAEKTLMDEKLNTEKLDQLALIAKVRDEFGRELTAGGNDVANDSPDLKHSKVIKKMKSDVDIAVEEALVAAEKALQAKVDTELQKVKASTDMGRKVSVDAATGDVTTTFTSGTSAGTGIGTGVPLSKWEAEMRKSFKEESIGDATAKGYKADSYYKQYKSLQEVLFAMMNTGGYGDKADIAYGNILMSIEMAMNQQTKVWDSTAQGVVDIIALAKTKNKTDMSDASSITA